MAGYIGDYNYLRDVLDIDPLHNKKRFERCLVAMQHYPSPWWYELSNDVTALLAMQLQEEILLIPYRKFKKGLSTVLKRTVSDSELYFCNEELKNEFKKKTRVEC